MSTVTTALCKTFKEELLKGIHDFTSHTFKLALIKGTPTDAYGEDTKSYNNAAHTSAGEALKITNDDEHVFNASPGNLGAGYNNTGGITLSGASVSLDSSSGRAFVDFSVDPQLTTATIDSLGCLIYNDSATGKPAVCTIGFGSVQSADNGTFTITFPAPGGTGSNAIIRIT